MYHLVKKSRRVVHVFVGVCFPGRTVISIKPGFIPSLPFKANEDTKENNFFEAEVNEVKKVAEIKKVKEVKEVKENRDSLGFEDVEDKDEHSPLEEEVE